MSGVLRQVKAGGGDGGRAVGGVSRSSSLSFWMASGNFLGSAPRMIGCIPPTVGPGP